MICGKKKKSSWSIDELREVLDFIKVHPPSLFRLEWEITFRSSIDKKLFAMSNGVEANSQ